MVQELRQKNNYLIFILFFFSTSCPNGAGVRVFVAVRARAHTYLTVLCSVIVFKARWVAVTSHSSALYQSGDNNDIAD